MSKLNLDSPLKTEDSTDDIEFLNEEQEDLSKTEKSARANFEETHVSQSEAKSFGTGSKKSEAF